MKNLIIVGIIALLLVGFVIAAKETDLTKVFLDNAFSKMTKEQKKQFSEFLNMNPEQALQLKINELVKEANREVSELE